MDDLDRLGEKLKELRTQRDLTLDMVIYDMNNAFDIEITKGNLSRWENGKNLPSLRMAAYLCKYYNISLDYLIGNTEVKTPTRLLTKERRTKDAKC